MVNEAPNGMISTLLDGQMRLFQFAILNRLSINNKTILILNNHESDISIPMNQIAKHNRVTLVTFHLHTSHWTWLNATHPRHVTTRPARGGWYDRGTFDTLHYLQCSWIEAFLLAFTPTNITKGLKIIAIYPLNQNIFLDYEFFPSDDRLLQGTDQARSLSSLTLTPTHPTINSTHFAFNE